MWSAAFTQEDEVLGLIATLCLGMGGRVHLVKNVLASTSELSQMYAWGIAKLKALKATYDPAHRLSSAFLRAASSPALQP